MIKTREINADASPEKRLFISLLTRDISLADAVLDLIDNCINSAIIVSRRHLSKPQDYITLLRNTSTSSLPEITITASDRQFSITDSCGGISLEHAESREAPNGSSNDGKDDRLSVYGIGLKRAIFKIGNTVENDIRSSEQWIFHETKR